MEIDMTYRFWNMDEALARYDELRTLVDNAHDALSDFRKDEAIYLALSDDEREELRALSTLMNSHPYRVEDWRMRA